MVAMLSASRSMVATSRMVGKAENSSGFSIQSETIRINTESAIEKARPMSIMKAGIGRKKMQRIEMMPRAKPMSRLLFALGWTDGIAAAWAMVHLVAVKVNMAAKACLKLPSEPDSPPRLQLYEEARDFNIPFRRAHRPVR